MFQFKVQIVLPFTPLTNSQWKTIYEGEVRNILVAQFEANREIENVRENPAQYGFPLGVRAVIADEVVFHQSLWTWPNWPKAKA